MRKKKQLDIATKGLREMIIKQNMRDFRKEQADKEARRSKEYGRVLYEVRRLMGTRSLEQNVTRSVRETEMIRSGDWSTAGQKRTWRDGGRTARGFTGEVQVVQESEHTFSDHPRFYAAKDEEVDTDSDEEEDEVLDFHKQKSEVIFWNDPRIR